MQAPKAPAPPDPVATAKAQTAMNKETAIAQSNLNMVDQITPEGELRYTRTGINDDGTPKWAATQTYSPSQQKLFDLNNQTSANLGQIGVDQSARVGDLLKQPININNEATEARLFGLGRARLDPKFAEDEETLRTRLVNSGIRQGTEAWDREFRNFGQTKNDAYNQLLLGGRAQAVQEALAERNQPINEISALMSGSQVSSPNFVNTPNSNVANTDYAGMVYRNYAAQMNQYNQRLENNNAMMGGLFGLGGALARVAISSDRRLKKNIHRVGMLANGLPLYVFDYIGGARGIVGVMADEARQIMPEAVSTGSNGFDQVDYAMVGV